MLKKLTTLSFLVLLTACTPPAGTDTDTGAMDDHSSHSEHSEGSATSYDRLTNSPRHQEWVEVKNGDKTIYTWVVYPEVSDKAKVVILIHENKGLNDWARSMADQVAEEGHIAVAPDLLSGFSADMTRTSDFATPDDATKAIGQLVPAEVQSDLGAVADWAKTIPSSDGTLVSAGFCWGGSQSFNFASTNDDLEAALVFYGTGPQDQSAYDNIDVPVFGFYGGADERVNATIDASEKAMATAGNTFEYEIYKGAGHAFMRLGEEPNATPENATARDEAWERMKSILEDL